MKIGIIIPTLNAGDKFEALINSIARQKCPIDRKLLIDSGSTDATVAVAAENAWEIIKIPQAAFNHGRTRQQAFMRLAGLVDIVVFMTQDIVLYDEYSLAKLIEAFKQQQVGAAYGRQIPFPDASPIAKQARLYNYPAASKIKTYADKDKLGIKTAFLSDSFAAYRCDHLLQIGGFPANVIIAEDMYVAAKLLQARYHIAYQSEAKVYHSHDYTLAADFRRYFDTGVFQAEEDWIGGMFGKAEGEGLKLVKNQLEYLRQNKHYADIPHALLGNMVKLIAYRLGKLERHLPQSVKKMLSGQAYYFNQD